MKATELHVTSFLKGEVTAKEHIITVSLCLRWHHVNDIMKLGSEKGNIALQMYWPITAHH